MRVRRKTFFILQDCYGPPPELPLASPSPGIVHHLLGPSVPLYCLTFNSVQILPFTVFKSNSKKNRVGDKRMTDHVFPDPM